jgi:hypothetical protein
MGKLSKRTRGGPRCNLGSKHHTEFALTMTHLLTHSRRELALCIAIICLALTASAAENEIVGSEGSDRLVGTPSSDYFVGGAGADVFVINYLSATPDVIADFDPEEGDIIELAFNSTNRGMTLRRENFSINRKGVVKYRIGNKDQDLVRLNRSDLRLELDPRKGRYFLKFSKEF